MTSLSRWKCDIPRDSAAHCYLYSYNNSKKNIHFTFYSSFVYPPASSYNATNTYDKISFPSAISYKWLKRKYLYQNGEAEERNNCLKRLVAVMVNNSCSRDRKRPLLKKSHLGSKKLKSVILLNIITIVYASNIAVIKDVETFTDPAYFSAVRFTVSVIPFLPFIFHARKDVQTRNSGLELGLWVSLGYLCEAIGLLTADAGRASFISLFTVVVVPILEIMFGAIVPARTWFGVFMSVLGISMLECSGSPPNIGDLFNFLGAIFFGIHTLRTEHVSRTTRKENLLALLGYEVGVVAVLSTVWYIMGVNIDILQNKAAGSWTWAVFWDWMFAFPWIPALYTGVFSTGLCLWGEMAAMRDVSATETAVIYGLEPVWGAGFAWFLLGERWGIDGWIGAALILVGSLTVQIAGSSASESREDTESKKDVVRMMAVSDQQKLTKTLSTSPVMVNSRNGVMDIIKK